MLCFALADRLGKSVQEVFSWPSPIILEWQAYLLVQHEDGKQQDVNAKLIAAFGKKDK